jgi:predicted  nucleic acid-binding Zn-ribbon protein
MEKKFIFFILFTTILASCNFRSGDYEALQAERDSLAQAQKALQEEMEGYFTTLNQVEQNIEKIKNAEKLISSDSYGEEVDVDTRNKINDDLTYINEMLKANRDEIAQLKKKLRKSSFKSEELERTLSRLTKSLEFEALRIDSLQTVLVAKDSLILQLNDNISELNSSVSELETENTKINTKIKEQDETIHTAWYVFGTREELKQQKILTSDGWFKPGRILESDFNKNYFVRIDARKTKSIPLYSSRAKILSSHPKSSYTLEKENGSFTLLITDTQDFWSVSRYLVIEVD